MSRDPDYSFSTQIVFSWSIHVLFQFNLRSQVDPPSIVIRMPDLWARSLQIANVMFVDLFTFILSTMFRIIGIILRLSLKVVYPLANNRDVAVFNTPNRVVILLDVYKRQQLCLTQIH